MLKKPKLILAVMAFAFGLIMIAYPLVQVLPDFENTAAASILDRFGLTAGLEQELKPGEFVTIVDEKTGEVIDRQARTIYPGDEIINESNIQYRVVRVKGDKAFAANKGVAAGIVYKEEWDLMPAATGIGNDANGQNKTQVAIYFTHTDESYVPTDGTESKPAHGGIMKVGEALADKLRKDGVDVVVDQTPHDPHDANAYHRSRKTAAKLLKDRPTALFDVHRDGVPDASFYNEQVEGEAVTRVRLVVGRQNPKMATNLEFAKNVKAYMDKHYPGLIRGIFIGRGNYNQDLGPRALLLEVGTHTNDRQRAERGAAIFADGVPKLLNLQTRPGLPGGEAGTGQNAKSWSTLIWIIGAVLVAGAAFLFISTGSMKGMTSKLGELRKTEFSEFLGRKKVNGKREPENEE